MITINLTRQEFVGMRPCNCKDGHLATVEDLFPITTAFGIVKLATKWDDGCEEAANDDLHWLACRVFTPQYRKKYIEGLDNGLEYEDHFSDCVGFEEALASCLDDGHKLWECTACNVKLIKELLDEMECGA